CRVSRPGAEDRWSSEKARVRGLVGANLGVAIIRWANDDDPAGRNVDVRHPLVLKRDEFRLFTRRGLELQKVSSAEVLYTDDFAEIAAVGCHGLKPDQVGVIKFRSVRARQALALNVK